MVERGGGAAGRDQIARQSPRGGRRGPSRRRAQGGGSGSGGHEHPATNRSAGSAQTSDTSQALGGRSATGSGFGFQRKTAATLHRAIQSYLRQRTLSQYD